MTQRRQFLLGACAAALPAAALAQVAPRAPLPLAQTNVIDALAAAGNYDNFIELISRAGAVETLRGPGPYTLLALSNAAMARLPNTVRETLDPSTGGSGAQRQDPDRVRLAAFVNMHIVEGRYTMADFAERVSTLRTRNGNMIEVNGMQASKVGFKIVGDSGFGVGGINSPGTEVTLASQPILCSNGIVLPISAPLIQ